NGNRFASQPLTLGQVLSLDTATGGPDKITTLGGDDIVIGGAFDDTIDAGDGNNVVFGDSGSIDYVGADGTAADIDQLSTFDSSVGGPDKITTGSGDDVVFGGAFNDTIDGGAGRNL